MLIGLELTDGFDGCFNRSRRHGLEKRLSHSLVDGHASDVEAV
jgi:hypothetical protein